MNRNNWKFKKLGELCTFISGYTPKKEELNNVSGYPYFKVSDMNRIENILFMSKTDFYLNTPKKIIPKNSIVFPKNGGAIFTGKKKILAVDSIVDLNTEAIVINDRNELVLEYLYQLLLSINFSQFDNGGGLPSLNIKKMKDYIIPVPPIHEQQAIAAHLDTLSCKVNQLQENYNKILRECDALKQALLREIFEQ